MAAPIEELIVQIQADLSQYRKELDKIGDIANGVGDETEKGFSGVPDTLRNIGAVGVGAFAGIATAIGGVILAVGKMSSDISKAQGRLQAMTGDTAEKAKADSEIIRKVYSAGWGESIDQLTTDYIKLQSSLGTVSEEALKSAQILGSQFETFDINQYSNALKQLKVSFPGKSEADLIDMITVAFQETQDKSGDLLDSLNEYAPRFASTGLTADDMFNMIIDGSANGAYNIDVITDTVKEFGIEAEKNSERTAKGFEALGMNATEMNSKIAQGGEVGRQAFFDMITALEGVEDKTLQNTIGADLFGTKWEDAGSKVILGFNDVEGALDNFQGATERAGDALDNSLGFKIEEIKRTFMDSFTAEDSPIYKSLVNLADFVLSIMPQITDGINNFMGVIRSVFGSGMEETAESVDGSLSAKKGFFQIFSEEIFPIVSELFNSIKEVVVPIMNDIGVFIGTILTQIKTFWDENGTQIMEAVSNIFNFIKGVIDFVMPAIELVISIVWDSIKNVIQGALDVIMGVVKLFSSLFTGDWEGMWEGVKQIFSGAIALLLEFFKFKLVGKLIGKLGEFLGKFVTKISDGFSKGFNKAKEWLGNIFNKVVEIFTNLISKPLQWGKNLIGKFADGISSMFGNLSAKGGEIISNIKNAITGKISDFVNIGKNIINGMIDGIKNMASSIYNKATEIASNIANKIKSFFGIKSPSRLMRSMFVHVGEGIELGLRDKKKDVENEALEISEGIKSPLENIKASVDVGLNKPNMEAALGNAGLTAKALFKARNEQEMKIELSLKGGVDKLADEIEARIVKRLSSSMGGAL